MENRNFWVFLIIAFILGLTLGIVYTNTEITGKAAIQNPPTILPISCTDTDGGWNLAVKGTCTDGNSTRNNTDYCFIQGSTTFLREYYCMSGVCQSTPYNCAALGSGVKCINGACTGNVTNATALGIGGTAGVGQTTETCNSIVGTCNSVKTTSTIERVEASQMPADAKVYTRGELTTAVYGPLQDDSQMNKKLLPTDEPGITLGLLCQNICNKSSQTIGKIHRFKW